MWQVNRELLIGKICTDNAGDNINNINDQLRNFS